MHDYYVGRRFQVTGPLPLSMMHQLEPYSCRGYINSNPKDVLDTSTVTLTLIPAPTATPNPMLNVS